MSAQVIPESTTEECRDCVFPFNTSYIPEYVKQRAKSELSEDERTVVNSLILFRAVLRDEADFTWPDDDDLFLLSFLRTRKFDIKRSFSLMKSFYAGINKYSRLFHNYDFNAVRETIKNLRAGFLPYRDKEGCAIFVFQIDSWNPAEFSLDDVLRVVTSFFLLSLRSPATQIAGIKFISDVKGLSLRHVPHISISHLLFFSQMVQNWCPARFSGFHVVNENSLFGPIWSIFKHLLSRKMRERWHLHGKNVKKLHKYFSPSILPAEYEGDLPPFDSTSSLKEAEENAEYINRLFSFGYQKHRTSSERRSSSGHSKQSQRRASQV